MPTELQPVAGMSPTELLDARVASQGNQTCLIEQGRSISWAEVDRASRAVAAGLAAQGVRPGDRVAIWMPNRSAWLFAFFACAQLGAIAVSVNTRFRSVEVADLLYRSGSKLLIYWPGYKDIDFAGILAQCPAESLASLQALVLYTEEEGVLPREVVGRPVLAWSDLIDSAPLARCDGRADSPCVIFTTSGTTRAPKLVVHSQRNVVLHARNVSRQYGLGRDDCFLLLPPFCGVYGFCSAMTAMFATTPLILEPTWNAALFADLIDQYGVTHLAASNDAVTQLLAVRAERAPAYPGIKFIVSANINPAHADVPSRAAQRGVEVLGLYGSSELQALLSLCDRDGNPERRGRAGGQLASPLGKVRARDPETGAVCPHGQSGELEFNVPENCFVEYFNDPEATRAAMADDAYFRTGDLGFTEADGSFTYLGRMGDTLRLGGFLVAPAEIEHVIQDHPDVEACQLVGALTKDSLKPVAFIRVRAGAHVTEAQIQAYTAGHLAKYKVPARVIVVEEYPTTPSANGFKVQKNKLREMAEALFAAA